MSEGNKNISSHHEISKMNKMSISEEKQNRNVVWSEYSIVTIVSSN